MATNKSLITAVRPSVTTAVNVYTSPSNGSGTRILAFTASLPSGTETYKVYMGTAANSETEIIPTKSIKGPKDDTVFGVINQLIGPAESIFVEVSTADTITFRASGIEF